MLRVMPGTDAQPAIACPHCASRNTHPGSTPEAPRYCRGCDADFIVA